MRNRKATIKIVVIPFVVAFGGCSIAGFGPDVDHSATKSLVAYQETIPLQEIVDPSDWDKVRGVMATALSATPEGSPLPWENDVTGTVGTIIPMAVNTLPDGRVCRKFSTTLNGVGGVLQYRGDACQAPGGEIELVDLAPHDAVVNATPAPTAQQVQ